MTNLMRCIGVLFLLVAAGLSQSHGTTIEPELWLRKLVHDPHLVDHCPADLRTKRAVCSEWAVNGSNYIIAYRSGDHSDPFDIVAEIYQLSSLSPHPRRVIEVPVFSEVDEVKLVSVTGGEHNELAFVRASNQLQLLTIITLHGASARKIFDYGATTIEIRKGDPTRILAYAKSKNSSDVFIWCPSRRQIVTEEKCHSAQRHH